jgi:competence protein ComEA
MGRAERGIVLLAVGLAVAGHGVKLWTGKALAPGDTVALTLLSAGSPRAHRDTAVRRAAPLRPGEVLDPNHATAAELARLPGIGMRIAKEIVADRELRGIFGSPEALSRVDGIGPATVRRLEPFLRFPSRSSPGPELVNLNTATLNDLLELPGIGPGRAKAILAYRDSRGAFAAPADLERVPGIGGRLAERLAPLVRVK